MVVDDPLDFTPSFTLNTWQTSSESANIIINATLFVLIVTNIGSALSKLVYAALPNRILYSSWLRGYIFAHSDDPLRILAWIMRKYGYRDPSHVRAPQRLRLGRLVLPLLARMLIFVASVLSIAVNVPTEEILDGCEHGDYRVTFDPVNANPNLPRQPICADIPLVSRLGSPDATAVSCVCQGPVDSLGSAFNGVGFIAVSIDPATEVLFVLLGTLDQGESFEFTIEWSPAGIPDRVFRSKFSDSISRRSLNQAVLEWVTEDHPECTAAAEVEVELVLLTSLSCRIQNASITMARIESRIRDSFSFEKTPEIQERGALPKVSRDDKNTTVTSVSLCMVPIAITYPIVNMVPLAIILLVWMAINATISLITRRYDNVLDVAFGLVRSALGHDATLNPLEECNERKARMELLVQNWKCGAGGYHRGFLGRGGDDVVETLDKLAVVGGCAVARIELQRSMEMKMKSAGSETSEQSAGGR